MNDISTVVEESKRRLAEASTKMGFAEIQKPKLKWASSIAEAIQIIENSPLYKRALRPRMLVPVKSVLDQFLYCEIRDSGSEKGHNMIDFPYCVDMPYGTINMRGFINDPETSRSIRLSYNKNSDEYKTEGWLTRNNVVMLAERKALLMDRANRVENVVDSKDKDSYKNLEEVLNASDSSGRLSQATIEACSLPLFRIRAWDIAGNEVDVNKLTPHRIAHWCSPSITYDFDWDSGDLVKYTDFMNKCWLEMEADILDMYKKQFNLV